MKRLFAIVSGVLTMATVFYSMPVLAQLDVSPPAAEPIVSTPTVTEPVVEPVAEIVTPVIAPADTTAPVISGVASLSLGLGEATIAWTTDELAVSRLEYGTTPSYGQLATIEASALLAHSAVITGLEPGATYHYCIRATDLSGNLSSSCGHSFTTAAETILVDATPPDVSLVTVTAVTAHEATISWTTDTAASAEVEYGTTAGYGQATPFDTALALTHSVTLTGLSADTEYHYRIRASDEIGNLATTPDNTFTTALETVVAPGAVSGGSALLISGIDVTMVTTSTVTVAWTTDVPSDSQVEYGDSEDLGTLTPLTAALTTSHAVTISGLPSNTNHIFRVWSKPAGAAVATVSGLHEFTTLSHSTPVVPPARILSVEAASVTESGATITWTTDKATTSRVHYGLSTSYGASTVLSPAMTASHTAALTGLDPGTTYHFRVESVDEASNITFSEDYAFTTQAPAQTGGVLTAQAAVTTLTIGGHDRTSVALVWQAESEQADISLEYEIRYGIAPITEETYASAALAQLTPIYRGDLEPTGAVRTYIVAGLEAATTYHFALKAKHQHGDWSALSNVVTVTTTTGASVEDGAAPQAAADGSAQTGAGSSPLAHLEYGARSGGTSSSSFEPTVLKAEPADGQVVFVWNNPGASNFVRTVIVRKEGGYPASPADGQTIYEGRAETFADVGLQNGKTYHYAMYSYNHAKTYSAPVRLALAPKAGNVDVRFNESGSRVAVAPIFHFVRELKKGDRDIEVEHLQELLVAEGLYPERYITGYFWIYTDAALRRFQRLHGLDVTGRTDAATRAKLDLLSHAETRLEVPGDFIVFVTNMKFGDQGEAVKDLQEYLAFEGSYKGAITGLFDKATVNAVRSFQRKYSILPASGIVGPKTRHRMQQLAGF